MNARMWIGACTLVALAAMASPAFGHCDTLDGPVARAGREALQKADLTPALRWVKPEGEQELRTAFEKARTVRALGADARDLADTYFLETLVRVHRTGEGEPYTGLKPADAVPAGIVLADKAIDRGDADALVQEATRHVAAEIHTRFAAVMEKKQHADQSVAAGRAYVEAYVSFIHYVEGLVSAPAPSAEAAPAHQH